MYTHRNVLPISSIIADFVYERKWHKQTHFGLDFFSEVMP